ncbi:hypothetical protein ADUPG1_008644, partial [Aduncisulcus paluster]
TKIRRWKRIARKDIKDRDEDEKDYKDGDLEEELKRWEERKKYYEKVREQKLSETRRAAGVTKDNIARLALDPSAAVKHVTRIEEHHHSKWGVDGLREEIDPSERRERAPWWPWKRSNVSDYELIQEKESLDKLDATLDQKDKERWEVEDAMILEEEEKKRKEKEEWLKQSEIERDENEKSEEAEKERVKRLIEKQKRQNVRDTEQAQRKQAFKEHTKFHHVEMPVRFGTLPIAYSALIASLSAISKSFFALICEQYSAASISKIPSERNGRFPEITASGFSGSFFKNETNSIDTAYENEPKRGDFVWMRRGDEEDQRIAYYQNVRDIVWETRLQGGERGDEGSWETRESIFNECRAIAESFFTLGTFENIVPLYFPWMPSCKSTEQCILPLEPSDMEFANKIIPDYAKTNWRYVMNVLSSVGCTPNIFFSQLTSLQLPHSLLEVSMLLPNHSIIQTHTLNVSTGLGVMREWAHTLSELNEHSASFSPSIMSCQENVLKVIQPKSPSLGVESPNGSERPPVTTLDSTTSSVIGAEDSMHERINDTIIKLIKDDDEAPIRTPGSLSTEKHPQSDPIIDSLIAQFNIMTYVSELSKWSLEECDYPIYLSRAVTFTLNPVSKSSPKDKDSEHQFRHKRRQWQLPSSHTMLIRSLASWCGPWFQLLESIFYHIKQDNAKNVLQIHLKKKADVIEMRVMEESSSSDDYDSSSDDGEESSRHRHAETEKAIDLPDKKKFDELIQKSVKMFMEEQSKFIFDNFPNLTSQEIPEEFKPIATFFSIHNM